MTDHQPAPRSRSRRRAEMQRLYAARDIQPVQEMQEDAAPADWAAYTPNEDEPFRRPAQENYTPNEPEAEEEPVQDWTGYQPNDEEAEAPEPQEDFSAYYRPHDMDDDNSDGPSFAPASGSNLYAYASAMRQTEENFANQEGNIYHPREADWAQDAWEDSLPEDGLAYQVQSDRVPAKKRRRKRKLRRVLALIAGLAAALLLLREPLTAWLTQKPEATDEPVSTVSPTAEPVSAYKASQGAEISASACNSISELSGTLEMEPYIVTSANIVTRSSRTDGLYDFYLFTADGRLLCYFEGLEADGVSPQPDGSFYAAQSPWLVASDGADLLRLTQLENQLGGELVLAPMQHGWSVAQNTANGSCNYINTNVQLLSPLWFSRAYPFTGAYTAGYVDTGSDSDQRYLLYVLGEDGSLSRWLSAPDMTGLIGSACGMAYLNDGSLYALPDTASPVAQTPQADAYPDCGAVVVQDGETGLYGLFVEGRRLYDCMFDRIAPVESDLHWNSLSWNGEGTRMTVHAVTGAAYPQPVAYSFALEKDGAVEYVSLSAQSDCPVRLDIGY